MAMLPGIGRLLRTGAAWRPLTGKELSFRPNSQNLSLAFSPFRRISTQVFVGGLSFYTTEKALTEAFSRFGEIVEVKIIMDRISQRSKGFGFVQYATEAEAEKAIAEMNGKVLNGRIIFVDTAKPKSQQSMPMTGTADLPVSNQLTTPEGVDEFEKL